MIAEADRLHLLALSRDVIAAHAAGRPIPEIMSVGITARRAAVFVTLHNGKDLRGCIGHLEADEPFSVVLPRCAIAASSQDPRFPAVTPDEVPRLTIELSVLSPPEPIAGPDDIEIGRHGLVVEQGRRRGLLLPQVASEWRWDAATFLAHTCHKAGLPMDAWKRGAQLWRFEAEVFAEDEGRVA